MHVKTKQKNKINKKQINKKQTNKQQNGDFILHTVAALNASVV